MSLNQPTNYIPFRETNYFSDFICDYLDEKSELKQFYNRFPSLENFEAQINEKSNSEHVSESHRAILATTLMQQYASIETSEFTLQNIEDLKSKKTFTITTGHQLNLFTGPLYFLYKIISTINLAKQLKEKYPEYNFVPIYWMASEDHDFEEINYFNFKGKKIQWNSKQTGAVGQFNTEGVDAVFEIVSAEFGQGKNAEQLKEWFKKAYLEHDNLADATRYLANELFGEQGGETTSARSGFAKKWGWYSSLYGLASGDITRFEDITKLEMHKCLMMLAFMKDKNELESKQIKNKFK